MPEGVQKASSSQTHNNSITLVTYCQLKSRGAKKSGPPFHKPNPKRYATPAKCKGKKQKQIQERVPGASRVSHPGVRAENARGGDAEDADRLARPTGLRSGAAGGGFEEGEGGALWVGHDGDAAYVLKIRGRQVELGTEIFGFDGYGIAIRNGEVG